MNTEKKLQENGGKNSVSCLLSKIFAMVGPMCLLIFVGAQEAQSSVMLPQLRKEDSDIRVTLDQETWIASFGVILAPISALVAGPLLDVFGRKKGLQFFYFNMGLGYLIMCYASSVYEMYIGRIITGIGSGLMVCSVVYLAEICTEKQREHVFSINLLGIPAGVLFMSTLGGYLSWRTGTLTASIAAFILFITQCFIPESPPWLFKTGQEAAAVRSLQVLGRSQSAIQKEMDTMRLLCSKDKEKVELRTFFAPTVWKPFFVMVAFFFLQSASGVFAVLYYAVDFVERLETTYDPLDVAVILSFVRLVTSGTLSVYFKRKYGRRFSLVFSSVCMTATLGALAGYVYVERGVSVTERPFQWFPIVCLFFSMVVAILGLLSLPWLMSGEVYPLKVRGVMTGLSHSVGFTFLFISVQTYQMTVNALEIYGLLSVFTAFSFLAIFFGIFILPETRNKSLQEIEESFLPKEKRRLITDKGHPGGKYKSLA